MITDALIGVGATILEWFTSVLPDVHYIELSPPEFGDNGFFTSAGDLLVALDWILPIQETLRVGLIFFGIGAAFLTLWGVVFLWRNVKW